MTYWMTVHHGQEGKLVAACDDDVLGETYTEGKQRLAVDEGFYGGEEVDLVAILDELETAKTSNFVGEQLIGELLDSDLVEEDEVERIDGVPHVQMYFI